MRTLVDPTETTESSAGLSLDYFCRVGSPIVAVASALGGPIAIIRVSGRDLSCLEPMIEGGLPLGGRFALRPILDLLNQQAGKVLDRSLVLSFIAPHSFTGENVVEFHCHGVESVVARLCENIVHLGVRTALPGEFSFRAVVNQKMTLSEAEALNSALSTESLQVQSASKLICQSDKSEVSANSLLKEVLVGLQRARGRVEAAIDFPEAESEQAADLSGALNHIRFAQAEMAALTTSYYQFGLAAAEPRVVIVGSPNVGKSTLYNILCGGEKALVSKFAGTTRDVLESRVRTPSGQWIRVLDTAGVREVESTTPQGELERIGIQSGLQALQSCRVLVLVAKAAASKSENPFAIDGLHLDSSLVDGLLKKSILVYSHLDELEKSEGHSGCFDFCSQAGQVRHFILDSIDRLLRAQNADPSQLNDSCVLSSRQERLLSLANEELLHAEECVLGQAPLELAGDHLHQAEGYLKKAIGEDVGEEYIAQIFSQFCLGK